MDQISCRHRIFKFYIRLFLRKLHKPRVPPCAAPSLSLRAAAHAHRAARAPLLPSRLSAWCHRGTAAFFSSARNTGSISSRAVSLWLRTEPLRAPLPSTQPGPASEPSLASPPGPVGYSSNPNFHFFHEILCAQQEPAIGSGRAVIFSSLKAPPETFLLCYLGAVSEELCCPRTPRPPAFVLTARPPALLPVPCCPVSV